MNAIITATDINGLIGNSQTNNLPWSKSKDDMKFFADTTKGNVVVMGYKTWQSLGREPLKDRTNIILSKNGYKRLGIVEDGKKFGDAVFAYPNLTSVYKDFAGRNVFFIGGSTVYQEVLDRNMVDTIFLTKFNNIYEGDIYFPRIPVEFKVDSFTQCTEFTRYLLRKRY